MSTPPPPLQRRSAGDAKKTTPPASSIVTRNGARKAKIQTRAMSAGTKPSASLLAAKKKAQLKKKQKVIEVLVKDPFQIAMDSKTVVKGPTGFVTEPRMVEHRSLFDDNHPESPERLTAVINRCREMKLIEQCKEFEPRAATKEELLVLHAPSVYEMLESTHQNNDLQYLEEISSKYDSIFIHPSTHSMALLAAGSAIDMAARVARGELQNALVAVRPPGHHAMRAEPCGYCFYNNVALAARHALDSCGLTRILIVDWDVHHGQATQQMFYDDPRVLYFSVHRYEHGAFWPGLRQADFHYVGGGAGRGYTFNVPLNATGAADADYLAVWHQLLLPVAIEYQPELILVSAGYDAAIGCPEVLRLFLSQHVEGEMSVSPACYASLTHLLACVCARVCCVLEGGYCAASLGEAAAHTLRALLGHPVPPPQPGAPSDGVRDTILNCIYAHKPYWRCFNYQDSYSVDASAPNVCDGAKQKHTVTVRWEGDETRPDTFELRGDYPAQDDDTRRRFAERLRHLRLVTDLSYPQHAVCYAYDPAMLKHRNIVEPDHVESPERILRIHERHRAYGLLARVLALPPRRATDDELLAVHAPHHLQRLKKLSTMKLRELNQEKEAFDSVYFHPDSLESASVAVGCVLQAVDAVLSGVAGAGVCVVRPPGHHADDAAPSGFCLLNSAAAAARLAVRAHGLRRVLLLDWDVHHGNGTQRLTYRDDQILYVSLHRYDHGSFFPHSAEADHTAVGEGRGEGYNVNIPWNKRGMGDAEYLAAFTQVVLPVVAEYAPELVLVSAGFDACVGDPLGGCKVTPECYATMTNFLRSFAGGRVVLCLEGGYNTTSISYAMTMCTKALLGDPIARAHEPAAAAAVHWSAVETINNVIRTHKRYWKNLKFQLALPIENVLEEPPPSRGLNTADERNDTKLSELSVSSVLDDSTKSIQSLPPTSRLDGSLASDLANLSIDKPKCEDGVHCGTDDEDEMPRSKDGCDKDAPGPIGAEWSSAAGGSSEEAARSMGSSGAGCSKNECSSAAGGSSEEAAKSMGSSGAGCSKNECSSAAGGSSEVANSAKSMTLVDYLAENMQAIAAGEMFAVVPLPWCPHLQALRALPAGARLEQGGRCVDCDETEEIWVCLHCYVRACGRSVRGHMQAHHRATRREHALVLSLLDLSVWCCACDAYVDHALLYDARNNAHRCKFHEDMPWCYPDHDRIIHMQQTSEPQRK